MKTLKELVRGLPAGEGLPLGFLTSAGLVQGLLVGEDSYKEAAKNSLQVSSQGRGFFSGHDGSMYRHLLETFESRGLGEDPSGETLALVNCVVISDMFSVEVPAMRLNPAQIVSYWIVEHKAEGTKFQGGGMGVSF